MKMEKRPIFCFYVAANQLVTKLVACLNQPVYV